MKKQSNSSVKIRDRIWDGFKIILAIGLLWYAIAQTDLDQIAGLVHQISPVWLTITLILFFMMTLLKALQYNLVTGGKAGYFRVLRIVIAQNAIANFVTTTAGVASYVTMMGAQKDIRFVRATFSFLIVKMADLIAVLILMTLSLIWAWPVPESIKGVLVVICAVILFILLLFFVSIAFRKNVVRFFQQVTYMLKLDRWLPVDQFLGTLVALSEQDSYRIVKLISASTGISLIYISATVLWGYARLRTFSFMVDFGIAALLTCVLQLASWLPVFVFGGLGISESISVYFFRNFGFDPFYAAAVLVGVRVFIYLMNALMLFYVPLERFLINKKPLQ